MKALHGVTCRVAVVSLAVWTAVPVAAQSTLGTIRGAVFDDAGSTVPRAALRVVDESTGVVRTGESDSHGAYEFPNLKAGTYRVEDNSPGFVAFRQTGVVLRAGETALVNLRISGVTEEFVVVGERRVPTRPVQQNVEITVTASSSNIQLDSPAIQGGLDAQQIEDLPRGSRDFQDFLFLTPSVLGHTNGYQFLSGRSYGVSYLQDGQPSNGALFGRITSAAPGLEAIDEIKVLSNSYSAEFGGWAAVVVTSRRGSNEYSGALYYDFNGDELNALKYDQKAAGLERGFPGSDTRDHRFAAALGGPVRKEKTFFFGNYEGSRQTQVGGGRVASVPSVRMRRGDFSQASFTIRDPRTGQPFPGNVIPADRLDPAALRAIEFFYPPPNLPDLASGVGRYQEFTSLETVRDRFDLRLDHELSASDSIFARGSWQDRDPGIFFENASLPRMGVQDRKYRARTASGSWVKIFSPSKLNEFRVGYNREAQTRRSHFAAGEVADAIGIAIPDSARSRRGLPSLTFGGSNRPVNIGGESFDTNANRDQSQSSLSVSNTFTWLLDRHSLKLGGLFSRERVSDGFSVGANGAAGIFSFNGTFTGNAIADLLLGLPASTTEGINTRGLNPLDAYADVYAAFVQDDWRVGNRLTLFLGLRYELITAFRERKNLLVNFDPSTARLVIPSAETIPFLTQSATILPRVVATEVGLPESLVRTDKNNFGPRVGFAYRIGSDNKTVLRGGAGLFYPTEAAQGIRDALSRAPFRSSVRRTGTTFVRGFSGGTPSTAVAANANAVDFDLQTPEIYQYNLTLERQLPGDLGLRLSYIGSRKRKLLINRNINTLRASTVPFDPESSLDRARLPYPQLSQSVNAVLNGGRGHMNAFQVEVRRRFRGGFAVDAAYTLADSRSDAPDFGNSSLGIVQYDPYDLAKNLGPDPHLVRHRFVMNGTWDLPVGRSRRFLSGMPGVLDALFGGWSVAAVVLARSGQHLTPFYSGVDDNGVNPANTGFPLTNNDFDEAWRPDLVGDPTGSRSRDNFYNIGAFRLPAPGTIGNAPLGILTGPGTWIVNLGIHKEIVRARRFTLEVRATLDNAFNHPQFYVEPVPDPSAPGFLNLSDYLLGGLSPTESNGATANLASELDTNEAYALGRVVRLGVRLTF